MNKDKHTKQENYKTDADFPVREFLPDCAKEGKYKKKIKQKARETPRRSTPLFSSPPLSLFLSSPLSLLSHCAPRLLQLGHEGRLYIASL